LGEGKLAENAAPLRALRLNLVEVGVDLADVDIDCILERRHRPEVRIALRVGLDQECLITIRLERLQGCNREALLHLGYREASFLPFIDFSGQFLNVVALVDHDRAVGLKGAVAGQTEFEVGAANGVNGSGPYVRKAIPDEGQKAMAGISGRDGSLLRAEDEYVSGGVRVPMKLEVKVERGIL
jgi:hypothetical protein